MEKVNGMNERKIEGEVLFAKAGEKARIKLAKKIAVGFGIECPDPIGDDELVTIATSLVESVETVGNIVFIKTKNSVYAVSPLTEKASA